MSRRQPHRAKAVIATVGLLALLAGLEPLALGALILLAAACMPAPSRAQQVAYALLLLFGVNAFVLTVLAVLGAAWNAHLIMAAYLVACGSASAMAREKSRPKPLVGRDIWAVVAAITALAVFFRPFFGASLGRKLALLSYSTDAGNHLSYVRTDLLVSGYDHASQYPQAWAGNVGLTVDLLVGQRPSPGTFIAVAVPLILGFYGLLVFFAVSLTTTVLQDRVTAPAPRLGAGVAAACFCLSAIVGSSSLLLESASYTQTLALTILLAVGLLLSSPELTSSWWSLAILGFLGLGLMQTWYLLAPVLAVLLVMYLVTRRPGVSRSLLMAAPFIVVALYPIVNGPPAVAQINAPGGAPFPGPTTVTILLLLLLLGLVLALSRRSFRRQFRVPTTLVLGSLVLTTMIVLVQDATGSGANYYAAKLLFAALLFAAVLGAALSGRYVQLLLLRSEDKAQGRLWVSAVSAGVLLGGYAFAAFDSRGLSGEYATGKAPDFLDGKVLDAIFVAHPRSLPAGTEVWIADGCARGLDRLANKWTHDLYPEADIDPDWPVTNIDYLKAERGDVHMLIERAASPRIKHFEVYVHRECDSGSVLTLSATPKVTVIHVP